ncbi:site-specific integrase [Ochrobactrum teleogrylli]|uniref:Site-specific integrase n=1 Tax=Ochrobactrum teleogrylli TaxID=2479765 RepID=A0ABD5JUT8_9HYPH
MGAYDANQTATLLKAVEGKRLHMTVLLAVMCGMRRGEIAALRWKHIDFEGSRLFVLESAEQTNKEVHYKEPKSGKGRVVDIPASVAAALKAHRARQAEELLPLGVRLTDETFIVADEQGEALEPRKLTDAWNRLRKGLDLPPIRLHDLRHTHATQMLAAGVHPKIASERLGHSTIAITLDLYSHVMPGMQANAAAQIDAMITRAVGKKGK